MSKKIKYPKVSKSPNKNWNNNEIQFARFIAEAEAMGVFNNDGIYNIAQSMDLNHYDVIEIIDRAQKVWDDIKEQL